jgi:hypothetical protein
MYLFILSCVGLGKSTVNFFNFTAIQQYQFATKNIRTLSGEIPVLPLRDFKLLSPEPANLPAAMQVLEANTIVLELHIASVNSAFLRRSTRNRTPLIFVPVYRNIGVNYLQQVFAKLYPSHPFYSLYLYFFFFSFILFIYMTSVRYVLGFSVDWQQYTKLHTYKNAKKVLLPNYAFDNVTCWFNDKLFRIVGEAAIRYFSSLLFVLFFLGVLYECNFECCCLIASFCFLCYCREYDRNQVTATATGTPNNYSTSAPMVKISFETEIQLQYPMPTIKIIPKSRLILADTKKIATW